MYNLERLRLFELGRFDREVLRPTAAALLDEAIDPVNQRYVLGELLEGYLWLELGVDLEIFPLKEARLLFGQRYSHASDATTEYLKSWGFLYDGAVLDVMRDCFRKDDPRRGEAWHVRVGTFSGVGFQCSKDYAETVRFSRERSIFVAQFVSVRPKPS